ncbi:hypothetical protein [Pseudogracilibacillus sp. SO30301A]|uniref:hypothetical protein n=1 Tax=Pseudogracilibacillus sp. SO30301A TaxID=3098291 RepID=UPI00300E5A6D
MAEILKVNNFRNEKRYQEREKEIEERENKISEGYKSDIRQYKNYCLLTFQPEGIVSFLDYLYISIRDERVKNLNYS